MNCEYCKTQHEQTNCPNCGAAITKHGHGPVILIDQERVDYLDLTVIMVKSGIPIADILKIISFDA